MEALHRFIAATVAIELAFVVHGFVALGKVLDHVAQLTNETSHVVNQVAEISERSQRMLKSVLSRFAERNALQQMRRAS